MEKALEILKACRERGQKRAGGLAIDEAIKELEEAMKSKTCEGCKWVAVGRYCTLPVGNNCVRNADDYFQKDTQ